MNEKIETNGTALQLKSRKTLTGSNMVKIALLSAISFILTLPLFRWNVPIFPGFLSMDFSDLPAMIALVSMGAVPALWVAALKNILDVVITGTTSAGIGPFANFLVAATYLLPMGYVISRLKGTKGIIFGAIVGTLVTTIMASLFNYTVLIHAYAFVFGVEIQHFIDIANAINSNVINFETFIFFSIAPFNLFKFGLTSIAFIILYKAIGQQMGIVPKINKL